MIEVTVRRFYKCDEGTVVPAHTFIVDESTAIPLMDLNKIADGIAKDTDGVGQFSTNLRLMTESEVEVYRHNESGEAEDF